MSLYFVDLTVDCEICLERCVEYKIDRKYTFSLLQNIAIQNPSQYEHVSSQESPSPNEQQCVS